MYIFVVLCVRCERTGYFRAPQRTEYPPRAAHSFVVLSVRTECCEIEGKVVVVHVVSPCVRWELLCERTMIAVRTGNFVGVVVNRVGQFTLMSWLCASSKDVRSMCAWLKITSISFPVHACVGILCRKSRIS